MKRWLTLFAVLGLLGVATFVVAARFHPSELERQHATIRNGMTAEEVAKIMAMGSGKPLTLPSETSAGYTWEYRPPKRYFARSVRLEVHFGADSRVIRTTADGVQVEPPYKWGNP